MSSISLFPIIFSLFFVSTYAWPNFQLYTRTNPNNYAVLTGNLQNTPFDYTRETVLIVHGFGSNGLADTMVNVKTEILKKDNKNVIIVDWKDGASAPIYSQAVLNVITAANRAAAFLKNNNINPKNVYCIGHSLGAHLCGFIGKINKLKRITGLDPAGPHYFFASTADKLYKTDALFVDNIHTDSKYGIQTALGHKDYYPNGGKGQPGCLLKDEYPTKTEQLESWKGDFISCSHTRSVLYFIESVNSACEFTSYKCSSLSSFESNQCNTCSSSFGCSKMGYYADKSLEEGRFYLTTNSREPFCKK